jgi:hypothetical protein
MTNMTAFKLAAILIVEALGIAHCTNAKAAEYASAEAAAKAGIADCIAQSTVLEYAGGVYTLNGAYFYTAPVTSGSDREVTAYKLRIPGNAKLVALFHTHPKSLTNDTSDSVSEQDKDTAKKMHLQSYIGVIRSGQVLTYTPRGI